MPLQPLETRLSRGARDTTLGVRVAQQVVVPVPCPPTPDTSLPVRPNVGAVQRTLSVTCSGGLANRLRVLASGVALAEATDRHFEMVWPTARHTCGAGFHQLFDSDLPVRDVPRVADPHTWTMADGHFSPPPDVLLADEPRLRVSHVGWLVDRAKSPAHADVADRAAQIIGELRPLPHLQRRIDDVAAQFRSAVVGVHVRRGDFHAARPDVVANLDLVLATVRERLDAGADSVFLATDDGAPPVMTSRQGSVDGVRAAFRDAFGAQLVETHPRSLDRGTQEAVEDAVVDLWLLRRCHEIVGTKASSFSELAAVGRAVPLTYCGGKARPHRRLDRLLHDLKLDGVIARWGRRRYGVEVPAVAVTHRLVTAPRRAVRWLRRR